MPVWSKDIQYGAAAGFIIIVGIVAIQFGFSAKLVLALLAGVGVLFCASLFEGLPRAAMLGAGAVLLLLVVYDLATSCDSACQQTRAEAAQQRAAQEQARLTALQSPNVNPHCNWNTYLVEVTPDKLAPLDPKNPDVLVCKQDIAFIQPQAPTHCFYARFAGEDKERDTKYCDHGDVQLPLQDAVAIRSAEGPLVIRVTLEPTPRQSR